MFDFMLYALTVAVWGGSWLTVKFQLGVVAPEVSILYRFAVAAAIMFVWCLARRRAMYFGLRDHAFMALQGVLLFCANYYLVYLGTQYLASGLVAVVFSTVVAMNIIGGAILLGTPIRPMVALGAAMGLGGIALVFRPELQSFDLAREGTRGILLCLAGTFSASLGMLTSARNQRRGLPVTQTSAYGMAYGSVFLLLLIGARGVPFRFDSGLLYVSSLVYLTVFATVIGFSAYLTLLGRIGADRASYVTVRFPIVALALSTVFEDFAWTTGATLGIVLVLAGNGLVLAPERKSVRAPGCQEEP